MNRRGARGTASGAVPRARISTLAQLSTSGWVVPQLAGGVLEPLTERQWDPAAHGLPRWPRQSWRIDEGVAMCRERYAANGATLAGVAPPLNVTPPMKFKEACKKMLVE